MLDFFRKHELTFAFISGITAATLLKGAFLTIQGPWTQGIVEYGFKDGYADFPQPDICDEVFVPKGLALNPQLLQKALKNRTLVPENLIVVARHSEDTSWLDVYLSEFPHIIYEEANINDPKGVPYTTVVNKGNEAMVYLQFIIDFYDHLPENVLFIHGNRHSWHLRDHVPVIRRLKWGSFPYANLRYAPGERLQWSCGKRTTSGWKDISCNWVGLKTRPNGMAPLREDMISIRNKDEWQDSMELNSVWPQIFQQELGDPPAILHAPCCAEFMVSKERILAHPKSFYVALRNWIDEVEIDGYRCGRQFEHTWHYIFGEPAISEPKFECDLLHCDQEQLSEAERLRRAAEAEVSAALNEYIDWT